LAVALFATNLQFEICRWKIVMQIVVFEDEHVSRLYPITVGRAAYAIGCASFRLLDWLEKLGRDTGAALHGIVRPHLAAIQRLDFPQFSGKPIAGETPLLVVNARLVPSVAAYRGLTQLMQGSESAAVYENGSLAAAMIGRGGPAPPPDDQAGHWHKYIGNSLQDKLPASNVRLSLFNYPHDVVRYNLATIGENLAYRLETGGYREIEDGVFAAKGATLGQYCVVDAAKGPVLLDEGAVVGPYSFLRGPAYLGPRARVIEHSAIKDAVTVGHTTKIGGEIEASIVEPYTNKQHHGFLGHSYLGSWINLGAGTSNSDLKNTYGNVKMEYRGEHVATGMQFVGCIMGDYAKSAINTGIFTGKTIGCCSMLYGFVTTNVPSFVNYARLFGQVTELPPEVMIATQQRMFTRRSVVQRECDIELIRAMYDLTRHERQLAGEPLAL
jgi:UDP-N-acetylglucosamine diphosphorylase / glucose-1-phosphate thymidylyltransferase / UDP-N-acetylgalactosamine diphosphorylase / glucosamine-1-phosphate N-acetyltransferase / galactosamine-1-phosphate N-acetyltransferase